jgi:PKD repeat protein
MPGNDVSFTATYTTVIPGAGPVITLTEAPANDSTVSSPAISISGNIIAKAGIKTAKIYNVPTMLTGEDLTLTAEEDESYSFIYENNDCLAEFANEIRIEVEDLAGNIVEETIDVTLFTLYITTNPPATDIDGIVAVRGMVPLEVEFAVQTSPLRTIVLYEGDFDGKGVYDERSNDTNELSFVYTGGGAYTAKIRVMDVDGNTNEAYVPVRSQADPGRSPVITSISANPTGGMAPLTVEFNGEAGDPDPDGILGKYEWDFNYDGVYDSASDVSANVVKTYTLPGGYFATLRVTDDEGLTAEQAVLVTVDANDKDEPSISLAAIPLSGAAPLSVDFTVTNKGATEIARYEWDFEGNGIYDFVSENPTAAYTYRNVGKFAVSVKATNDKGLSAVESLDITVTGTPPGGMIPDRTLKASGPAPLTVNFAEVTGKATIAGVSAYLFDFTGDGTFDLESETLDVTYKYIDSGSYGAIIVLVGESGWKKTIVVRITVGKPFTGKVYIRVPKNGWTISGSKVTLVATMNPMARADLESLRFQHSPTGANDWVDIGEIKTERPFVTWLDTTLMDNAAYDIRCLVTLADGAELADLISVGVDNATADYDVKEEPDAEGEHTKEQKVRQNEANKVFVYDGTEVSLPSSGMLASADLLTVKKTSARNIIKKLSDPQNTSVLPIGAYCEVSLPGGHTTFTKDVLL